MQKFFNLAFVPLLISLSSFSLDSCKNKFNPNDFDFSVETEKINGDTIDGGIDASNFGFKNNKKNRYFTMAGDCWCHGTFSDDNNPWTYNKIAKVYVTNDVVWDKVASAFHFNRGSSIEEIKRNMIVNNVHQVSSKFKFDANVSKDSCYLVDFNHI